MRGCSPDCLLAYRFSLLACSAIPDSANSGTGNLRTPAPSSSGVRYFGIRVQVIK